MGGGKSGISSDPRERKFEQTLRDTESRIQHEAIEHSCVFDQYGNLLEEVTGDEGSVSPSSRYMNMINARATHNHPDIIVNGMSFPAGGFSWEDLWQFAQYRGLKELRAIDSERHYSLKRVGQIGVADGKRMAEAYRKAIDDADKKAMEHCDKLVKEGKLIDDEYHYNKEGMRYSDAITRKWLRNHAKDYGYQYSEHTRR